MLEFISSAIFFYNILVHLVHYSLVRLSKDMECVNDVVYIKLVDFSPAV